MVALPGTMRLQWSVPQDMHHSDVYPLFPDVSLLFGEVGVLDDVFVLIALPGRPSIKIDKSSVSRCSSCSTKSCPYCGR